MAGYDWQAVNELLDAAFDDEGVSQLAFNLFPAVYDNFPAELRTSGKIRDVIQHARRVDQVEKLLAYVKDKNPAQFARFEEHLVVESTENVAPEHKSHDLKPSGSSISVSHRTLLFVGGCGLLILVGLGVLLGGRLGGASGNLEPTSRGLAVMLPTETAVSATSTLTPMPTSTPIATPTSPPLLNESPPPVVPVLEDEIMVLVAQFESSSASERDVSRFIFDNLQQTLEREIPFSKIRLREYKQVIQSDREAVSVAEETGAAVIVWGSYDELTAFAEIQLGSMQPFLQPQFEREILEQNSNVVAKLDNPRRDSIARYILNIIVIQQISSNESFSRSVAVNAALEEESAELVSGGLAAHVHQYSTAIFKQDYDAALSALDRALRLDAGNPFSYFYRGGLLLQLGEFGAGTADMVTAQKLSPDSWMAPVEAHGFVALFQANPTLALRHFSSMVEIMPEEWRVHYYVGLTHLLAGDYALAHANMDQAILLEPDVNWPYIFAIQIALREGRLIESIQLSERVLQEFPDPSSGTRALESALGGASIIGPLISAFGNGLLGQYQSALNDVDFVLSVNNDITELHWLRGFAHCNLGEFEAAIAAYSVGIDVDPSFPLNFLSRGALFWHFGQQEAAEADFQAIRTSEQAAEYEPLISFVQAGALNCQNFLSFDPTNLVVVPTVVPATSVPIAEAEKDSQAVLVQVAPIFVAPFDDAVALGELAVDEIVMINGRSQDKDWLYITAENGLEGFVALSHLETSEDIELLQVRMPKYGVVIDHSTVFSSPSAASEQVVFVALNELVEIIGRSPNGSWFFVRTQQEAIGFVAANRIFWQGDKLLLPLNG